ITALGASGAISWTYVADRTPWVLLGPDGSLIVATTNALRWLDRTTGAQRFSVTVPTSATPMSAIGNRLFVTAPGGYLNVYDAATGQYLGRTTAPVAGGNLAPVCTPAGLVVTSAGYNDAGAGKLSRFARCQ